VGVALRVSRASRGLCGGSLIRGARGRNDLGRRSHQCRRERRRFAGALIAHDPRRAAVRTSLLHRIHHLDASGERFEPPTGFDIAGFLVGSLGRFTGEHKHDIHMALDVHAPVYARERPWHHSQQLADQPDGGARLTLRLVNLTDTHAAVWRWGEHAKVLAPAKLRAQVAGSLRAASARYEPLWRVFKPFVRPSRLVWNGGPGSCPAAIVERHTPIDVGSRRRGSAALHS